MTDMLSTYPDAGAVESAADAEARLRLGAAHLFAVSDWLARTHLLDSGTDDWHDVVDGLGHELRALAQRIRMANQAHRE